MSASPEETHSATRLLLDLARGGDGASRGGLFERLRPRVLLWVSARLSAKLRSRVEPDDVAQEILLAVHRDFESWRGQDLRSFYAWLFRIAENRIRDLADHHNALKRQPIQAVAVSQTTPGTAVARAEELGRMLRALETLGDDHRTVIRLRHVEERDVDEVAEIMERSANAVRILHCRALKALREKLPAGPEMRTIEFRPE